MRNLLRATILAVVALSATTGRAQEASLAAAGSCTGRPNTPAP